MGVMFVGVMFMSVMFMVVIFVSVMFVVIHCHVCTHEAHKTIRESTGIACNPN